MTSDRQAIDKLERRLTQLERRLEGSARRRSARRSGASDLPLHGSSGTELLAAPRAQGPSADTAGSRPDVEQPASASRQKILDAAVKLFSERGYAGTSLRDIVEPLGMTPANIYNHFPNKEAILYHAIKDQAVDLLARLSEALTGSEEPDAELARATEVYIRHFVEDRSMSLALRGQYLWVTDDHRAELIALRDRIERLFRSLVATCLDLDDTAHPLVFLTTTNLLSFALLTSTWFKPEGSLSVGDLVSFAVYTVHGVRDRQRLVGLPLSAMSILPT